MGASRAIRLAFPLAALLASEARPIGQVAGADQRVSIPLVLQMRPLGSRRAPILDAALAGDHLLLLDGSAVTRYERHGQEWRILDSRPIVARRHWPRDLRGRLRVDAADIEVFLPGVTCRGPVNAPGLACVEGSGAWPLPIENVSLTPARNYFPIPGGPDSFSMAPIAAESGAHWLVTSMDGRLLFLDASRKVVGELPWTGDEVAAIATPCAAGSHVLLSSRTATDEDDTLRLYRVGRGELTAVGPPLFVAGRITALWPAAGDRAVAIVRNGLTGRYEAFHVSAACGG